MKEIPKFSQMRDQIQITVTGEGLRIELLEKQGGMFFDTGNADPSESGKELLTKLAEELGHMPNHVLIEGHTDAKPYTGHRGYSNWELSADRANSARRLMQEHGLRVDQVAQVRGFADQSLRRKDDPEHDSNRRITVIVQYRGGTNVSPVVGAAPETHSPAAPSTPPAPAGGH